VDGPFDKDGSMLGIYVEGFTEGDCVVGNCVDGDIVDGPLDEDESMLGM